MRHAIVLVALLAGCIKPPTDKSQRGPTISVTLDPDSGFEATSTIFNPGTLPFSSSPSGSLSAARVATKFGIEN